RLDIVHGLTGDLVGVHGEFEIESLLGVSQQKQANQNKGGAKDGCNIQSAAYSHADRGHYENSRGRGDPSDQIVPIVKDGAGSDEADAGNDLRRDACVVAQELDRQRIREQGIHRGADADKEIRTQPRGTALEFALQSDSASPQRRQRQPQQEYSRRGHLALQDVVYVLHDWHGTFGGWILSPENFALGGFQRRKLTQMITGPKHRSGRSLPWPGPKCESRPGERGPVSVHLSAKRR